MTAEMAAGTKAREAARSWGSAAKSHLALSALFLVFGLVAAAGNTAQLLWPEATNGVAFLSFGRLRPMAFNLLVLGFGGLGLIGAAYYTLPRLVGGALVGEMAGVANAVLGAAGLAAGVAFVGLGDSQGTIFFELPWWSDVIVFASLATSAAVITATARTRADTASPAAWFLVAGSWWLAAAFLVGNVPGFSGVNSALQNAFSFNALAVLGLVGLAVGTAYAVAGDVIERGHRGTRVGRLGFWSFAFIAGWLGPRLLTFGPIPDWLETIGVVFAVVFLIPVWAVLSDLAPVLGAQGLDKTVRRFMLAGGFFLALLPLQNLVHATRSPSSIVQFTAWGPAFELVVLLGVVGCWLFAFVHHIWPERRPTLAAAHWWGTIAGVGIALAGLYGAGLHQGLVWVGGANDQDQVSVGEGFINAVEPLDGWFLVAMIGLTIVAVTQVVYAQKAGRLFVAGHEPSPVEWPDVDATPEPTEDTEPPPEPAEPIGVGVLVWGAIGLFAFAAVSVFLIPTLEATHSDASIRGLGRDFPEGSLEAAGRDVYVTEGCVYCHTQQVRPIVTDVQLGPVSLAGDYVDQVPALMGYWRFGPDLFAAGTRETTESVRWNIDHLRSPRRTFDGSELRSWSNMPSYDYLSDEELLEVATYIVGLK